MKGRQFHTNLSLNIKATLGKTPGRDTLRVIYYKIKSHTQVKTHESIDKNGGYRQGRQA